MRELVHIQGGQCGNQIGAKFWEVISDEHGPLFGGWRTACFKKSAIGRSKLYNKARICFNIQIVSDRTVVIFSAGWC